MKKVGIIIVVFIVIGAGAFLFLKGDNVSSEVENAIGNAELYADNEDYKKAVLILDDLIEKYRTTHPLELKDANKIRKQYLIKLKSVVKEVAEEKTIAQPKILNKPVNIPPVTVKRTEKVQGFKIADKEKKQVENKRPLAAVVKFTISDELKSQIDGKTIAVLLEDAMSSRYRLVTRSQISKSMEELKFQTSDLVESRASEFGKMLGAEYLITGSIVRLGEKITVAAQVFETETGAIKQTAKVTVRDVKQLNFSLTEVARILNMSVEKKLIYEQEQVNYPRFIAEGKDFMKRELYKDALQSFKLAQIAKNSPDVQNLVDLALSQIEKNRTKLALKEKYLLSMRNGRKFLEIQNWTAAKAEFLKAASIDGYEYDMEAQQGIVTAKGGVELMRKQKLEQAKLGKVTQAFLPVIKDEKLTDEARYRKCLEASAILKTVDTKNLSFRSKGEFDKLKGVIENLRSTFWMGPNPGEDWTVTELGIRFVWIKDMNCWVGKYEVTNSEFKKFRPRHTSRYFNRRSLDDGKKPVVFVSYYDATEFAKWLTDNEKNEGRLKEQMEYRLPTGLEWTTYAKCGLEKHYPWGNEWPPKYGNYHGMEGGANWGKIAMFADGIPLTGEVSRSGKNEWGLFGVGGNVAEWTKEQKFAKHIVRGGGWLHNSRMSLTIDFKKEVEPERTDYGTGFRLILINKGE